MLIRLYVRIFRLEVARLLLEGAAWMLRQEDLLLAELGDRLLDLVNLTMPADCRLENY